VDQPHISFGYDEGKAKRMGWMRPQAALPNTWSDVILQGSHFGIATPYAKQPNNPFKNGKDWVRWNLVSLSEDAMPRTALARACDKETFRKEQDVWNQRLWPSYYRLIWRAMIDPKSTERSLFSALIPPGPTHVHAVHTLAVPENSKTALISGFWAALPLDYLLRITGRTNHGAAEAKSMPSPDSSHPLSGTLLIRALRLNCLSGMYKPIWAELWDGAWPETEGWTVNWPSLPGLADPQAVGPEWTYRTPLRTEYERRAALVEIDALVAAWLHMTVDQLIAIYRSRYPILADREDEMWFDSAGRRIAADPYAFGYGQTREHWEQFQTYLENPSKNPSPDGYTPPFYKADRVGEYRQAHVAFTERMKGAAL
jgi:hypothetical protein